MKNKVIEFFQNLPENKPEQFNKAFELYRESPTKSESIERILNASGYSELSLNNLLYDLQKMHGISDLEKLPVEKANDKADYRLEILDKVKDLTQPYFMLWLDGLKDSEVKIPELIDLANSTGNDLAVLVLSEISIFKEKVDVLDSIVDKSMDEIKTDFNEFMPTIEYLENIQEFAVSLNNEKAIEKIKEIILYVNDSVNTASLTNNDLNITNTELVNQNENLLTENEELASKNEELEDENQDLKNQVEESQKAPKINAESLRVEFPFLNEKDCPNELKILVADKITTWNEYISIQEDISNAEAGKNSLDTEQLKTLARKAVELFEENQKIYDELNAYKETGKVLGKHSIFRTLQLSREVEEMTPEELYNYKGSTSKFFTDNNKKIKAAEKENDLVKIEELKEKISARKEKLELVNKKLGIKK